MSQDPSTTVLRLDLSRTARAFKDDESLWAPEIDQIRGLLDEQANALHPNLPLADQPVLSIAIFGNYGSGKTSLLRTLADHIQRDPANAEGGSPVLQQPRYHALPMIRPNTLAPGESFLYAFLAAALSAENQKRSPAAHAATLESSERAPLLTPVQQDLQKIAEYLQVIDDRSGARGDDPLGYSLERLERHMSDLRLRGEIATLIGDLADSLTGSSGSILLLPIDDADMSTETLVATLDTFRRYLVHPRLVCTFTFMGRLAESLLGFQYTRSLERFERQPVDDVIQLEEQIALEYLAKLFPVRNRIRLGPATQRLHEAKYTVWKDNRIETRRVVRLLEKASVLLFGSDPSMVEPRVRLALRPVTLRRQLQILDAMHDSGVSGSLPSEEPGFEAPTEESWLRLFQRASWTLLDAHRDILNGFDLYLDELFSLPAKALREKILGAVFGLEPARRRKLVDSWRHRTEDRRSQVLSLLAATIFRPIAVDEQAAGERSVHHRSHRTDGLEALTEAAGLAWFLELWTGFYLPQVLLWSRSENEGTPSEVGWNLLDGPSQAVRVFLQTGAKSLVGMIRLSPEKVAQRSNFGYMAESQALVEDLKRFLPDPDKPSRKKEVRERQKRVEEMIDQGRTKEDVDWSRQEYRDVMTHIHDNLHVDKYVVTTLLIKIWCFYGYNREGRRWCVLSYWRGLALIGRVLAEAEQIRDLPPAERLDRIRQVVKDHCNSARVVDVSSSTAELDENGAKRPRPGDPNAGLASSEDDEEDSSENGEPDELEQELDYFEAWLPTTGAPKVEEVLLVTLDFLIWKLASQFEEWLDGECPPPAGAPDHDDSENAMVRVVPEWHAAFARRMHGDFIISRFWSKMEASLFEIRRGEGSFGVNVDSQLTRWTAKLLRYWDLPSVDPLLRGCPILEPFLEGDGETHFMGYAGEAGKLWSVADRSE